MEHGHKLKSISEIDFPKSRIASSVIENHIARYNRSGKLETWDQIVERCVSTVMHRIPSTTTGSYEKYDIDPEIMYGMVEQRIFLPNSPALRNLGLSNQIMACFVLGLEDTMESIASLQKDCSLIFKSGGGIGVDWSDIRPENSTAAGVPGAASGPLSFMSTIDSVIENVKSGGARRGAFMSSLRYDHPDILKFIVAKQWGRNKCVKYAMAKACDKDEPCSTCPQDVAGKCHYDYSKDHHKANFSLQPNRFYDREYTNMNLSVGTDENFWDLVEHNGVIRLSDEAVIEGRNMLKLICYCAYRTGDPGILMLDRLNKSNPTRNLVRTVNPCLTDDTWIPTDRGMKQIKALIGKQFGARIDGRIYRSTPEGFSFSGVKDVYELTDQNGKKVKATKNHRFLSSKGEWVEVGDIKEDTILIRQFVYDNNTFCQDEVNIVSIEHIGTRGVYDCQIPNKNAFIANGFISHNCGESILTNDQSCCLGSIDVCKLDMFCDELQDKIIYHAVVFLNMLHEINQVVDCDRAESIRTESAKDRKIGLGVMGFADLLVKKEVGYGTGSGLREAGKCFKHFSERTQEASRKFAGVSEKRWVDNFENSMGFVKKEHHDDTKANSIVNIIAPTGTLSRIADCSSGIEPYFELAYFSKIHEGGIIKTHLETRGPASVVPFEIVKRYIETGDRSEMCSYLGIDPDVLATAGELSYSQHLDMQNVIQEFVDGAISKTINMPSSATKEDIYELYLSARKRKFIKGFTIFRDGCDITGVLSAKNDGPTPDKTAERSSLAKIERPKTLDSKTYKTKINFNEKDVNAYVTIGLDNNGKPFEVFLNAYLPEEDIKLLQIMLKSLSMNLRYQIPLEVIIEQLEKIPNTYIRSLNVVIANILKEYLPFWPCEKCGEKMAKQSGCWSCQSCGYSKCG